MAMTLGKDVSQLFPDVLKNIATADLDQKKLVYLYLMFVQRLTLRINFNVDFVAGTTQSPTPISVFSPSILSSKIQKTRTPSFEHSPSEPWAVYELTR